MVKPTSCIALIFLLLLSAVGVMARQEGDQKRKVPAMSSDDTDAAPSTKQPTAPLVARPTAGLARYSPESCGLSIELPRKPFTVDTGSAIERQGMGSVKVYTAHGDDYTVSIRHYELPRRGQPSPEECIKTFFRAVKAAGIYTELDYTILDKSADRASFRMVSGEEQGRGWEGFALVQGRHAWIIHAVYALAKPTAVQQVKSILSSARLDDPPCPQ
jgi:hypothetical protein